VPDSAAKRPATAFQNSELRWSSIEIHIVIGIATLAIGLYILVEGGGVDAGHHVTRSPSAFAEKRLLRRSSRTDAIVWLRPKSPAMTKARSAQSRKVRIGALAERARAPKIRHFSD
jgi:hypothetical protein